MSDENLLSLLPAAKARRDLMIMGMEITSIQAQVAQIPTRSDLARAALGLIFCTATGYEPSRLVANDALMAPWTTHISAVAVGLAPGFLVPSTGAIGPFLRRVLGL